MYTNQQPHSSRHHHSSRLTSIPLISLTTTLLILGIMLLLATSFWTNVLPLHFSKPSAKAAPPLVERINVPYFSTAVPFNQTAIFWFGDVTSTDNYTDVRIGYNSSELYVDLHIVDRYLWYDPNTTAPDLTKGDNAKIYLNTTQSGSSVSGQSSYAFQAGVNGYQKRNNYQKAYTGNGTAWTPANIQFTAVYGWRGHGFNGPEDAGWSMTYHIPFSSLGVSSSPSQGTIWKLAVQVHNRDDAANTPIPDKWWPASASATSPSSWGTVAFGIPTYQPPQASKTTTYTIRNKLNNQVVTDGMVGGSLSCGNSGQNRWTQWGTQTYPGAPQVNIQNESDISDWNCFSKFYITFPLSSLPSGNLVANAHVTLYEYGNAGTQGQPNPSYMQIATINQDWNPATLSWNTAPLVGENITSMLVPTKSQPTVPPPGLPITWDISRAVAAAYAAGGPLRLVFYSTDDQYSSGKYFSSSTVADWNATARPTLQVTLGS